MRFPLLLLAFLLLPGAGPAAAATTGSSSRFLEEFPHLKQYLFTEPTPPVRFGLGLAPIMVMNNKAGFALNLLELHWTTAHLDWTVISGSYGTTFSGDALSKVSSFSIRTVPKFRISSILSAGPLLGYEFVSFSEVKARLYKNTLFAPEEAFSTRGLILGAAVSENFTLGPRHGLKLSQMIYRQNYDPVGTTNGWKYFYSDDRLNVSKDLIAPGLVFLFEVSVLY